MPAAPPPTTTSPLTLQNVRIGPWRRTRPERTECCPVLVPAERPEVDVGNATALAGTAVPGAATTVVLGRFEHVNFMHRPAPIPVRVTEVVPPEPAKLLAQAVQAVEFDEDLPPVELILDAVEVEAAAAAHPAPGYLLPCRGSGADLGGAAVSYLDTRPAERGDWLLIGCERSVQFHRHF